MIVVLMAFDVGEVLFLHYYQTDICELYTAVRRVSGRVAGKSHKRRSEKVWVVTPFGPPDAIQTFWIYSLEKLYGQPDLLMAYKNLLLIRILASTIFQWVSFAPFYAMTGVALLQSSIGILRNQMQGWMSGAVDLSDPRTGHAINMLDALSVTEDSLPNSPWSVINSFTTWSGNSSVNTAS